MEELVDESEPADWPEPLKRPGIIARSHPQCSPCQTHLAAKTSARPRADVDPLQVAGLRARGLSWNEVANELKMGRGTAGGAFRSLSQKPLRNVLRLPAWRHQESPECFASSARPRSCPL